MIYYVRKYEFVNSRFETMYTVIKWGETRWFEVVNFRSSTKERRDRILHLYQDAFNGTLNHTFGGMPQHPPEPIPEQDPPNETDIQISL